MLLISIAVFSLNLCWLINGFPAQPKLVTASVGSSVVLPCDAKIPGNVMWEVEREERNIPIELASDGMVINGHAKRFTLVPSVRGLLHNLMINRTQLSDAGIYVCTEDNGASAKHYVVLNLKGNGVQPHTVVVDRGLPAVLPCQPQLDANVMWEYEDTYSHLAVELASWGEIISGRETRFALVQSSSESHTNLLINVTEQRDAGLYICTEDNGAGRKHYVILKVPGDEKTVVISTSNKSINLTSENVKAASDKPLIKPTGNVDNDDEEKMDSGALIIAWAVITTVIAVVAVVALGLLVRKRRKRRKSESYSSGSSRHREENTMKQPPCAFVKLPEEMLGLVLVTSAAALYTALQKSSTEADNEALTIITSVSSRWKHIMAGKYNIRRLKFLIKRQSSPCRRRLGEPQILIGENNDVNSFTILGNYFYIIRGSITRELSVIDMSNYTELHSQTLTDVAHPTGLVGLQSNNKLYVGDSTSRLVWSLTPWTSGATCELESFYDIQAVGQSVRSLADGGDGTLVVLIMIEQYCGKTWRGKLELVDGNGKCLKSIHILDDIVNPTCVSCINDGKFVIAGLGGLSLLDNTGHVISTVKGVCEFPCSVRCSRDHEAVFVADSGSGKVLLFAVAGDNSKLVLRKLVKRWDDWRTIQAKKSFIKHPLLKDSIAARTDADENNSLLECVETDLNTTISRFQVQAVQNVTFASSCLDNSLNHSPVNGSIDAIPLNVERDVERYQKRPVRVVCDTSNLIVGLNSGEILAYKLQ